jgi:hypothetical protein
MIIELDTHNKIDWIKLKRKQILCKVTHIRNIIQK